MGESSKSILRLTIIICICTCAYPFMNKTFDKKIDTNKSLREIKEVISMDYMKDMVKQIENLDIE